MAGGPLSDVGMEVDCTRLRYTWCHIATSSSLASKAQRELGWSARTAFDELVAEAAASLPEAIHVVQRRRTWTAEETPLVAKVADQQPVVGERHGDVRGVALEVG